MNLYYILPVRKVTLKWYRAISDQFHVMFAAASEFSGRLKLSCKSNAFPKTGEMQKNVTFNLV